MLQYELRTVFLFFVLGYIVFANNNIKNILNKTFDTVNDNILLEN